MDFFEQQDRARRNTRFLVILFALAVLALILLVNALVTAFIWIGRDYNVYAGGTGLEGYLALISWERFATIGLAVAATVAFVSLIRWLSLAAGGKNARDDAIGSPFGIGVCEPSPKTVTSSPRRAWLMKAGRARPSFRRIRGP